MTQFTSSWRTSGSVPIGSPGSDSKATVRHGVSTAPSAPATTRVASDSSRSAESSTRSSSVASTTSTSHAVSFSRYSSM